MKNRKLKKSRDFTIVTILSLLVAISPSTGSRSCSNKVEIVCESIDGGFGWTVGSNVVTCYGDESINVTFSDSSVLSILHSNKWKVANIKEITSLYISGATVKFIPFGIKTNIPNLRGLSIRESGLLSISKENLKQFGCSLEFLDLGGNKLTSIDENLLEYNTNLTFIYLNDNPIRHIDADFFKNLIIFRYVKSVHLETLNCMDQFFNHYGNYIGNFKWNNENCTDSTANDESQNLISNSKCSLEEMLQHKDDEMTGNDLTIAFALEKTFNEKIDKLNSAIYNLKHEIGSENGEIKKSTDYIMQQLTKGNEKMSNSLEAIINILERLVNSKKL